jgi:hypothetical protein
MPTVRSAVDRALAGLATLAARGETITDEWQYATDLEAAWRARLEEVAAARGGEPVDLTTAAAVDRAAIEAESIEDPHRALDWMSTLPQVALLALGEAG